MNTTTSLKHSLTGKVAFVQGGSRGIGAAIEQRLAQEGAAIAFSYANSAKAAQALMQSAKRTAAARWRCVPTVPMPTP